MSQAAAPHGPGTSDVDSSDRPRRRLLLLTSVLVLLLLSVGIWFAPPGTNPPPLPGEKTDLEASHETQNTTGSQGRLLVNQTSVVTGLTPGAPAQHLRGTFTNLNAHPVLVTSVTAEVTQTNRRECLADEFVIGGSPAPVGAEVAPGADQGSWSGLTIRMRNRPLNQDACKNTRLTIQYTVQ